MWWALFTGILPLVGIICWFWYDIWYAWPLSFLCSRDGTKLLPPGHMGIPFFGDMLNFLWYFKVVCRPEDFINAKRRKYGEVGMFRTHLFGSPSIIIWSPSINKHVLQTEAEFGSNWPTIELIGMHSLTAKQGAEHTRLKSFIVRAINHPDALRKIALSVQPRIISALQSWAQKGKIVAYEETKKLTFENIAKYFASFEPGPRSDTLANLFVGLMHGIRAYPLRIPGTSYYHAFKCKNKAISIFEEELKKRKENLEDSNDLMDGLIHLRDKEGGQLSDIEVLENIVNLVIAGHESTALSFMWAFYHLNKNPHVLNKLREENMSISKKQEVMIDYDEITKFPYTRKVVEEIVRMANISPFIFREASDEVELGGYKIPKGWKVICWIRYVHTNPEYFHNPFTFNPDRWDKEEAKVENSYWFGGGKRVCAGNMLARMLISIFLHHLVLGYRWELANPDVEISYLPKPKPVDGVEISIRSI